MEGWTVVECLYFAVVTLTTTGYGDLSPSTNGSKLFTCAFAFCGIAVIMGALGLIGCASDLLDRRGTPVSLSPRDDGEPLAGFV